MITAKVKRVKKQRESRISTLKQAKRIIKMVTGFTIVLIGIAGLFLPFLQGIVTIVLGLAILGTEFVWARRLMKRFEDGANNLKNSVLNNKKHKGTTGSDGQRRRDTEFEIKNTN